MIKSSGFGQIGATLAEFPAVRAGQRLDSLKQITGKLKLDSPVVSSSNDKKGGCGKNVANWAKFLLIRQVREAST